MFGKTEARARVRSLPPLADSEAEAVVAGVRRWLGTIAPTTVVVYSSMPGEIPIERVSDSVPHRIAITRTPDHGWLTVHPYDSAMEHHRFGFLQPVAGSDLVPEDEIGVVLVPGVSFDPDGNRLGHGAGYYDEFLSRVPGALRVGVTLERWMLRSIPTEAHDIPMTHLATEAGVRQVSPSR